MEEYTVIYDSPNEYKLMQGDKELKLTCRCGSNLKATILSHIVDLSCPNIRLWNFWKHSFPLTLIRR